MKLSRNLGLSASLLCAVHCLALPVVLTLGTTQASILAGNFLMEVVLIAVSILIGVKFIFFNDLNKHQPLPIALFLIGASLLVGHLLFHDFVSAYASALGGVSVALAQILTWRSNQVCSVS